jgi:transcriptional regulator with XRE-family HTH domain
MVSFFVIMCLSVIERGRKSMKNRVSNIRKALHLSQESFGSRLGVTGASISRIEKGERSITEQMILAICREFNVREEWLRDGKGDMFLDFTEDEFAKAAASLSSDAFVRSLIVEYWKLDDDGKKLFREFIHRLSDSMRGLE